MSTFPTLTAIPSYPLSPDGDLEDMVIRSPQASGYVQTRPRTTRARRNFGLNYNLMSDADVSTLRTFELTTLHNGADSFSWTHPLSAVVYIVQLTAPIKFSRSQQIRGYSTVYFNMCEV